MTVRDLLWKAYPDGYLPMRGAATIGGWSCVRESNPRIYSSPNGPSYGFPFVTEAHAALEAGDLLPNIDPENDPATWGCLKRELAIALGWPTDDDYRFRWFSDAWTFSRTGRARQFPGIDRSLDRATAFAIVRAHLRAEGV